MELVAQPALLFLDEPTSGLDSTTSHSVIQIVVKVSKASNCTAVAVIHQPRFETLLQFDYVMLLATGGHLVYNGPTKNATEYFQQNLGVQFQPQSNPADVMMDAISLDSANDMVKRGEMQEQEVAMTDMETFGLALSSLWVRTGKAFAPDETRAIAPLPNLSPERCDWGVAIVTHFRRAMLQLLLVWKYRVCIGVVVSLGAILISTLIDVSQNPTLLIVQAVVALFSLALTQAVAAQRVYGGEERVVAWREASVQVNMILYFAGRNLAALVEILAMTMFFTVAYYPLCPYHMSFHGMYWSTFAYVYAIWGLNFVFSIVCDAAAANMVSVVVAFVCQLLVGMDPSFLQMISISPRVAPLMIACSPIRWTLNLWMWLEMRNGQSPMANALTRQMMGLMFDERGFPGDVQAVGQNSTGDRWLTPLAPNAYATGTNQLYMLGGLFRFVALICLIHTAKTKSTGGGTVVETSDGSAPLVRITSRSFYAFVVLLVRFELYVILATM